MKYRWLLYLFGINLLAELMALYYGLEFLQYFTKPLLMIIMGWFVLLQPTIGKRIKTLLLFAILFSLGGDVFLLFDQNGGPNFILGLFSFLLAHLFYIILFLHIKKFQQPPRSWNAWIIAALLLYVTLFILFIKSEFRRTQNPRGYICSCFKYHADFGHARLPFYKPYREMGNQRCILICYFRFAIGDK